MTNHDEPWRNHDSETSWTMTNHDEPWRNHDSETSRTMTNHDEPWRNHDETMTVKHHEPWRTMTKPWQWNITNHDEPWQNHDSETSRHITNHDDTSRTMTTHHNTSRTMTTHHEPWQHITTHHEPWQNTMTHHDRSQNIMKHYEPLQSTINHHNLYKNYCKLSRKKCTTTWIHTLPIQHLPVPKNWQTGICLRKGPKPLLLYLFYSKSSPTLKTNRRSILSKLTYGRDPLPRNFPISWYCKVDTGMHKPNIRPELEMQQMLQLDLLLRPANLTSPVPTWHGAPSQVNHTLN